MQVNRDSVFGLVRTEVLRIWRAFGFALEGLKAAFRTEQAFRLEAAAAVLLILYALSLQISTFKQALLVGVVLLVLMVELLNTALEKAMDRISTDPHPLTKTVKDLGAAAVLVALINAAFCWWILLF